MSKEVDHRPTPEIKPKYQVITQSVTSGFTWEPSGLTSEKLYDRVTGIAINATDLAGLRGSTFGKLQLSNKKEIFPDGYPAWNLYAGEGVGPDEKFQTLEEIARGGDMKFKFVDGANAAAYPYTVWVTIRYEDEIKGN